jgi:hypothetical protein
LKFGADYRWLSPFISRSPYSQFAEFSGVTISPGGAPSGIASFADTEAEQSDALLSYNFSFYGHDTLKPTPRLTLTYGSRWDINPPLKGKNPANDPFTVEGLNDPATLSEGESFCLLRITYGQLRNVGKSDDTLKRRTRKHLDFPPPRLRTRGLGVRISPGAPLSLAKQGL